MGWSGLFCELLAEHVSNRMSGINVYHTNEEQTGRRISRFTIVWEEISAEVTSGRLNRQREQHTTLRLQMRLNGEQTWRGNPLPAGNVPRIYEVRGGLISGALCCFWLSRTGSPILRTAEWVFLGADSWVPFYPGWVLHAGQLRCGYDVSTVVYNDWSPLGGL